MRNQYRVEQKGVKMGRIEKVNNQVKREIGRILLQELGDPRLQFVTITEVDVSRDLRNAKIHFSVLGEKAQIQSAQEGLDGARGMIRKLLGQSMNLRHTPELFFIYDQSIEASIRIEETLKEIHDEHENNHHDDSAQ
jgi:ribosome-binding factor A